MDDGIGLPEECERVDELGNVHRNLLDAVDLGRGHEAQVTERFTCARASSASAIRCRTTNLSPRQLERKLSGRTALSIAKALHGRAERAIRS